MPRLLILILASTIVTWLSHNTGHAQIDYSSMDNWLHHPEKPLAQLRTYNLDVAVIGSDESLEELIEIENNGFNDTGVDIFWVHPTYLDTETATDIRRNTLDELPSLLIGSIALAQGGLLAEYGRFFAPRYRQTTAATFFINDSELKARIIDSAYQDVKAAFNHYLENHNNGNRFIIAGHSQGSYHLSFLLHDVIEKDPNLSERMIMAALGGMSFMYAPIGADVGGNLEKIRHCKTIEETSCYVTWRSYQDGQNPQGGGIAVPTRDDEFRELGLVHQPLDPTTDQTFSDDTYYANTSQPLDHYIVPVLPSNPLTPDGVRFAAYNDFYAIRHQRFNDIDYGHMVSKIYQQDDEREDDLSDLESSPGFSLSGYHQKDYNIYIWAIREEIKAKLAAIQTSINEEVTTKTEMKAYPNPAHTIINLDLEAGSDQEVRFTDILGKVFLKAPTPSIDVSDLPAGWYQVQVLNDFGKVSSTSVIILD